MTTRSTTLQPRGLTKLFVLALLGVLMAPAIRAANEEPTRGFFGIVPRLMNGEVKVAGLTPGGPAQEAGIKEGDILVLVDGNPATPTAKEGAAAPFQHFKVGDQVEVVVRRGGELKTFHLTLAAVPPLTREQQERIEEAKRKANASRVADALIGNSEKFELSFSKEGRLRFRTSPKDDWQVLEPEVADLFKPLAQHFLKDAKQETVWIRMIHHDNGDIEFVQDGKSYDPGDSK